MLTADYHNHLPEFAGKYEVDVVSGPQTGSEGSIIEEVRQRGINLTIMPELRREISPVNDIKALFLLRDMMKKGKYDLVHTHSSKAGVLGRLAAKMAGVPYVVHTVHGWSYHEHMSGTQLKLYTTLEKLGHACGHASIVVSPKDIDKGLAEGIGRREDYTVIRSGIELDRFGHPQVPAEEIRADLGIPQDVPIIGSVTRLSPQKAPLDLIKSIAAVAEQNSEAWFVIVGDGPLRPDVEQAIAQANLQERVVLTGLRRDVPELLNIFDIFVLTSLWEGLPRVLPQAMASGLPIVCTKADGSAEAVQEGVNGYLVPQQSPQETADRLLQLLNDPELRQKMGSAGRQLAPPFGAKQMVRDIDKLYQSLIAKRKN